MKRLAILFILTLFCASPLASQGLYFPPVAGAQWDTVALSSLRWNTAAINPLFSFLDSANTKAFIVLKDGKIAIEKYFGTFTKDSLWYWASAGKSMTSVLVGIAQQEGFLSISDTSSKWIHKGWTSLPPSKEDKITVRHQLTMTTGLDDDVPDRDCTLSSCLVYRADAGTRWAYHNAPYTLLDSVIEHSTGMSLNQFYLTRVRAKIGMNGFYIRSGYNNVLVTSPRSMARFGLLILNRGTWGTVPILTDTAYFNAMVSTSQHLNLSYGYLWWLNGKSSFMLPQSQFVFSGYLASAAPKDMFAALGKNGQLLNVVPSLNLVFVRLGDAPDNSLVPTTLNNQVWERLSRVVTPPATGVERTADAVPESSALFQNYPNPFNPSTTIRFALHRATYATVKVYDLLGKEVASLLSEELAAGTYTATWKPVGITSGTYYCRLNAGGCVVVRRMVYLQ